MFQLSLEIFETWPGGQRKSTLSVKSFSFSLLGAQKKVSGGAGRGYANVAGIIGVHSQITHSQSLHPSQGPSGVGGPWVVCNVAREARGLRNEKKKEGGGGWGGTRRCWM